MSTGSALEPTWTVERLALVLALTFGLSRRRRPDTAAAAAGIGVSRRTVQRWLHGPGRSVVRISAEHLARVYEVSRPAPESLRQEQLSAQYAREVITRLRRRRGRGVLASWKRQRWLEPHLVAVLAHPRVGLRQVATGRADLQGQTGLAKRGEVLDQVEVPTRFHATLLVHAVLLHVDRWRVQAPRGIVSQGGTQVWIDDAPSVDLAALAVTITEPLTPSPGETRARSGEGGDGTDG